MVTFSKKNRAIFLDRDGTINVEKGYLYKIQDFEYIEGVIEALKKLYEAGFLLAVITNQSGIARGYYTEEDFHKLNDWMKDDLNKKGVSIAGTYYCPHHPESMIHEYRINCECRKPRIGLFQQAANDFDIDMEHSYAIGDKYRDVAVCEKMPVQGILLDDALEKNEKELLEKADKKMIKNLWYARDLSQASEMILQREKI